MNATDNKDELAQVSARIITEIIRSSSTKTLLAELVKDLINSWADKGGIRAGSPLAPNGSCQDSCGRENGNNKGISADVGRLLTVWAKKVNADHAADTACRIGTRGDAIHSFLKNTDFGEIREMVEGRTRT